jgi:hypothetical protein
MLHASYNTRSEWEGAESLFFFFCFGYSSIHSNRVCVLGVLRYFHRKLSFFLIGRCDGCKHIVLHLCLLSDLQQFHHHNG